jgi:beta-lactamase regulating signal transducer with metallopeptidase domain
MSATAVLLHMWQTTVVLAFVFLLDLALRRAPARVSNSLWSIGLAKLFVPVALGVALFRQTVEPVPTLPAVNVVLYPFGDRSAAAKGAGSDGSVLVAIATATWIAVALLRLWSLAADLRRARRLGGQPPAARLSALLARRGIPRDVVRVGEPGVMPLVVGCWRPRIVVPRSLVEELSDDELGAILLHEDAHRRRRDPLRSVVYRLAAAVFWVYPPLYLVLHRLATTAEYACDEHAIRAGVSAPRYVSALTHTISLGLASPSFVAPAASATGSLLRRRLRRLSTLNSRRLDMRTYHRLILTTAAIVVAASAFYPAVAGDQSPAKLPAMLKTVAPIYPREARVLMVAGKVYLKLLVDAQGVVNRAEADSVALDTSEATTTDQARLADASQALVRSAIAAVMQWTFKPGVVDGKPTEVWVAEQITFMLRSKTP